MATKSDPSSAEHHIVQSAASTITSSVSAPKVSMFGAKAKSGFVIPKNKLSGSLVPKFRPGGKSESSNTIKEESTRQGHRKTKWGPDLTLDAAVRKGRALAYQTRLEQITELLKSRSLDTTKNQGFQSPVTMDDNSVCHAVNNEALDLELLELERLEVIGELLRINPSYKPPSDYKPLLKEAKIPIHTKEHGNKFVTLLLGPASNTQKRLEEETGAKVQIHGVKRGTREKSEITLPNISDADSAYEELYICVLADTFEKVDAAVQLIELLLTPVSQSSNAAVASTVSTFGSGDNLTSIESNQKEITSSFMTTALPIGDVNQGALQPMMSSAPSGQQQYPVYAAPWYSSAYSQPSTGFVPTSVPHNTMSFPASQIGPFRAPSYSSQPPQFGSAQGSSTPAAFTPLIPMQRFQQPPTQAAPPQGQSAQQPSMLYPSLVPHSGSTAPTFAPSHPTLTGSMPTSRPAMPLTLIVSGPFPTRPLPTASSLGGPGWSRMPQGMQPAQRPIFHTPMRPNLVISPPIPSISPQTMHHSLVGGPPAVNPMTVSNIPPNVPNRPTGLSYHSMPPQLGSFSSPAVLPLSSGAPIVASPPVSTPRPLLVPSRAPRPLPMPAAPAPMSGAPVGPQNAAFLCTVNPILNQTPASSHPLNPVHGRPPVPAPSFISVQAPRPDQAQALFQEKPPNPGSLRSFSPATQATATINSTHGTVPKPLRPISGDFTFQPLRAQVPAAVPYNQSAKQAPVPLAVPQPPSFRPAGQTPASSVNSQGLQRQLATNPSLALIPPPPAAAAFSVSPAINRPSSNFPSFSDTTVARPMASTGQIGPPSFPSASVRPVNIIQPPQNQGHRENQIYDPFSPSSISSAPSKKVETDAEYEDLMASFGVK